jgi:hypothetical protein
MIHDYILKLMENLPDNITKRKTPLKIDLILGGGAFNGSYILGALYFLKELERKNYIHIQRISTCSISSILGLLYLTDNLDKANELYFDVIQDFKHKCNLSKLFDLKQLFEKYITNEICSKLNKKLYICYNNIVTCQKCVIHKYKDTNKLFDVITRSCFVPFIIDFQPCYKDTYIDGIIPYFFKSKKSKKTKRLYLDVYTLDKLLYSINVKNEQNNYHRLFEGLLDIHKFFIKKTNTTMCSDLDNWTLYNYAIFYIYILIERIVIYFISFICFVSKMKTTDFDIMNHIMKPIVENIIKSILMNQCF